MTPSEQIGYNSSDILQLERKVQLLEQWVSKLSETVDRQNIILSMRTPANPEPVKVSWDSQSDLKNDEFSQALLCRTTLYTNFVAKQTCNVQFNPEQVAKWSTHQFMVEVLLALQNQITN